jgi:hypothetical protein
MPVVTACCELVSPMVSLWHILKAVADCAGIAKYGKGQATDSVTEAVKMLLENNLLANLPLTAQMDANGFRNDRCAAWRAS